ncbi:hypothetical protein F383_32961 [Gossypium arboreum]|uniref:Uncharacterized protein n=1 Tax=Gossypium arboreum TaxID=29729 RepID=A0A0B0PHQ2_GOSAR|nr:hypothetical protein F383_32961 [Gossypium arboreum]
MFMSEDRRTTPSLESELENITGIPLLSNNFRAWVSSRPA